MVACHKILACVFLLNTCNSVLSLDISKNILNALKKDKSDTLGDLKRCRVTHSGVEYEGNIAQTKSGILCQNWETPDPIHKVAEQIVDTDFPEGSKKKAKNYCRNPQHWSGRPWCYTLDFNITDEECIVPLCAKKQCRLTGPGVEYAGSTRYSGTRECLPWENLRGADYKDILFNSLFPDGSRQAAGNKCRNPDSDLGGPWCYVQPDAKDGKSNSGYKKAYCGIPLCEPKPCMAATTAVSTGYQDYHTVFSLLPPNTTSLDFSVRLWHPDQWHSGELKLALAVYPLPTTGGHMRLWKTGIEVIISTYKSGLTPKGAEDPDWNIEPGLLSGLRWTDLELSWSGGFISLKVKGKAMAVFTKDYTGKEKELSKGNFQFYSIKGSNALWNFPSCSTDFVCEEHLTTHGDFERRWPLPKISRGFEVKFHVRGFHTAIIEMKSAAMLQYPSIQLTLVNSKIENKTTLTLKESPDEDRVTLEEIEIESLLSYWEWKEFSLKIDGPRLELFWFSESKPNKLMSVMNSRFEFLKWFSIGSRQSTVHWTIGCSPPPNKLKIPAEPPECVMSEEESEFSGSQSVSATGLTCVPWADATGLVTQEYSDSSFIDGSKEDAKNYCRNPSGSVEGPYCYAADLADSAYVISKQNCSPRRCRSKECRMAGTGNDYIGSLGVTMTNRTCQRWTAKTPHAIPQKLVNKETFPELSVGNISNFCRNPTHDLAGPWCYTDDPAIDIDICDVPDCDVPGSCTVIVKGNTTVQKVYILPLWKISGMMFKVKSWDPKWNEGMRLLIELEGNNTSYYRLDIGAGNNDKIILTYTDSAAKDVILKQKTVARVIPSGHWVGFILTFGFGELSIKYENTPTAFFHCKYTFSDGVEALRAKFISYSALSRKYAVGMAFQCEECHTHISQPGLVETMYPIKWWQPKATPVTDTTLLRLNVRGAGTFVVVLMRLSEETSNRVILEVSDYGQIVVKNKDTTLAEAQVRKVFNNLSWTNLTISIKEQTLLVSVGNKTVIDFSSKVMLVFYFFSISVSDGYLTWNANCAPPNIDGLPVNGGWSSWGSWECSVTCGGGHGRRSRICDRPKPNLLGEPCNGSDTMEGKCNDFKCGDVPPELYKEMAARITKQAHNIRLAKGERLLVKCDEEMLSKLKEASPSTKVEWIKDGVLRYQEKIKNLTITNVTLLREKAHLNDSGIYICGIEDRKKQRAVVQLIAVIVTTNTSTRSIRKDSTMVLDCQVNPLTFLFSDLTQFWTLNGKLYQDYGASSHSLVDVDVLSPVTKSHEGVWECVVVQVKHNLTWTTTWFRLRVKKSSVFAVMFDQIFIGRSFRPFGDNVAWNSFFALILLLVFVFVVASVVFLLRSRKKIKRKYPRLPGEKSNLVNRKTSKLKKSTEYKQLQSSEQQ